MNWEIIYWTVDLVKTDTKWHKKIGIIEESHTSLDLPENKNEKPD